MLTPAETKQLFFAITNFEQVNLSGIRVISLEAVMNLICTFSEFDPKFSMKNGTAHLEYPGHPATKKEPEQEHPAVKEIEEVLQAADKLIQDHAKATGATFIGRDAELDIQGWGTAERLIDKEQVQAWKAHANTKHPGVTETVFPDNRPPPTSIPSDGTRPDTRTKWQKFWDWIGL